jgi:hypothetical protein
MNESEPMRNLHLVEAPVAPAPLIERSLELDALRAAVRGGSGVVVIEAAAGLGKTVLLDHAAALAEENGYLVRRAAPGPLEQHLPFGVVRALLEAPVRESGVSLDGPAAAAGELLITGQVSRSDSTLMLIAHSVLWVCSALAEKRPLALVVDDAQWSDRASLAVLSYLARRVEDLPLLILVAARTSSDLLSVIGGARSAAVLHPRPLSARGAVELIRRISPDTPNSVCRDCHRDVGGNPWLLSELARQLGADALGEVSSVARGVVRRRLAELSARDRGVVEAMAVIGDGAAAHVLASVAGVPVGELAPARDELVAAGLLAEGGTRFAHALIAAAIASDLVSTERERLHREAARALMIGGGDSREVAGHLLECSPQADPEVSEYLRLAACTAAPVAAARYLQRALDERAPGDDRAAMLAQLSTVSFDAGLPGSRPLLLEALRSVAGSAVRGDVLVRLGALAFFEGEACEAALEDPIAALDALMDRPSERARRVGSLSSNDPLLARVVLAHRAWVAVEQGDSAAAGFAVRALEGDVLLRAAHQRAAYVLAVRALIQCDHALAGTGTDDGKHAVEPVAIESSHRMRPPPPAV